MSHYISSRLLGFDFVVKDEKYLFRFDQRLGRFSTDAFHNIDRDPDAYIALRLAYRTKA